MEKDSNWLFEARKKLKMTQQALADRLGVAKNYIYLIESGRKPLTDSIRSAVEKLDSPLSLTPDASLEDRVRAAERRADIAEQKLKQVNDTLDLIIQITSRLKEAVK